MRTLEVFLLGNRVGTISETRKGGRFSYDLPMAQRFPGSPILSLSLPVKSRPFGEAKTANWFEGLLPEGPRRDETCRKLGISPYDWIGLLAEIGWECAGAVQVFTQGEAEQHGAAYRPIGFDELSVSLSDIASRQPAPNSESFRMSLGGFQDKMAVAMPRLDEALPFCDFGGILLPLGDAPSTHILKPEPSAYPGIAESEAWAMTVASSATSTAKVALMDVPGAPPTLVVERYDRSGELQSASVARIHQEDACQALGIPPERKYASQPVAKGDDPTYRGIAQLLVRYADDPQSELEMLMRQMVVNFVLGNWDAHAKNISLLYRHLGTPALAPLYDVVPITDVEPRTNALSLRIAGSLDPTEIARKSLITEAGSWGMGEKRAGRLLDETLEGLQHGIAIGDERYPHAANRHKRGAEARMAVLRR